MHDVALHHTSVSVGGVVTGGFRGSTDNEASYKLHKKRTLVLIRTYILPS